MYFCDTFTLKLKSSKNITLMWGQDTPLASCTASKREVAKVSTTQLIKSNLLIYGLTFQYF